MARGIHGKCLVAVVDFKPWLMQISDKVKHIVSDEIYERNEQKLIFNVSTLVRNVPSETFLFFKLKRKAFNFISSFLSLLSVGSIHNSIVFECP